MCYNHKIHAGNAGDVWKHFILAEVAEYLLAKEKKLVYVESHVGYPEYPLAMPGEWQDGIGRCWTRLNALKEFSYFQIIDQMNPAGLRNYPGSATVTLKVATKAGFVLEADVWDTNPEVEAYWYNKTMQITDKFKFHLGDGFLSVGSLVDRYKPALLLIDPPYLEREDLERSADLSEKAASSGWTVLSWQMIDVDDSLDECCNSSTEKYSINFSDVGLSCGKWFGAVMTLAGSGDLQDYVNQRVRDFLRIMQHQNLFKI
jgi:23S rRNA (adenine2030-N6)-methyltransferase